MMEGTMGGGQLLLMQKQHNWKQHEMDGSGNQDGRQQCDRN